MNSSKADTVIQAAFARHHREGGKNTVNRIAARNVVSIETGCDVSAAGLNNGPAIWRALHLAALSLCVMCAPVAADTPPAKEAAAILFDIPAQPLDRALRTYSVITGLEVFYNTSLAEGHRSAPVAGVLSQAAALKLLLRGTGYVPRVTGTDSFTIVPVPRNDPAAAAAETTEQRYGTYFAAIQARIVDAVCRNPVLSAAGDDLLFKIWLEPKGTILRAEILDAGHNSADVDAFAIAMAGLNIGAPMPKGMSQPVKLAVFAQGRK
jgi:hypothetical protein